MKIEEEATEFKNECLAFEGIADRALNVAKGRVAWLLFAWAHSPENPCRCTRAHAEQYAYLARRDVGDAPKTTD
jgi:hypothetical protein